MKLIPLFLALFLSGCFNSKNQEPLNFEQQLELACIQSGGIELTVSNSCIRHKIEIPHSFYVSLKNKD